MRYALGRPSDNLVYDGKRRGEIRADDFVGGSGLGGGFGATSGDTAAYEFNINGAIPRARLVVRYRMKAGEETVLRFIGLVNSTISFSGKWRIPDTGD